MDSHDTPSQARQEFRQAALEYHEFPSPGKIAVTPTKQLTNQRDLALAYSPGVAAACEEIASDPANAFRYTARGNLVAVITKQPRQRRRMGQGSVRRVTETADEQRQGDRAR